MLRAKAYFNVDHTAQATKPQYVVPKGESGRLCGVSGSLFSGRCLLSVRNSDQEELGRTKCLKIIHCFNLLAPLYSCKGPKLKDDVEVGF